MRKAPSTGLLKPGPHPGFSHLKSQPGVYRCKLRPVLHKRDPKHADYEGVLPLANGKARVLIWVHQDGSLGLRLEKITSSDDKGDMSRSPDFASLAR